MDQCRYAGGCVLPIWTSVGMLSGGWVLPIWTSAGMLGGGYSLYGPVQVCWGCVLPIWTSVGMLSAFEPLMGWLNACDPNSITPTMICLSRLFLDNSQTQFPLPAE